MDKIRCFFAILCFILGGFMASAQSGELEIYKKIIDRAESNKVSDWDKDKVWNLSRELDKLHPAQYFEEAMKQLSEEKYNEAVFLFYLGRARFGYYNATNPNYSPSNDGALAGALVSVLGEPINFYAYHNIDNLITILSRVQEYYEANDYTFYPKKNNVNNYNKVMERYNELIENLKTKKSDYKKQWQEQKKQYKDLLHQIEE